MFSILTSWDHYTNRTDRMDAKEENKGIVELGQRTLEANREHLDAVKSYTQKLEIELETLDKLVVRRPVFFEGCIWRT